MKSTGFVFPRVVFAAVTAVSILAAGSALALENKLARTPPMGWNSWNHFRANISEKLLKETADAIVKTGMRDAGYVHVNIDDCWSVKQRDADGNLQADPKKFPSGMKALADYMHAGGLKLGIYSDAGDRTCAGYPGSKDHVQQDADTFAKWGIDYLKYDWCNTRGMKQPVEYKKMSDALLRCGRPIVFSICEWGSSRPWQWAGPVGNLWRTTGDIGANWRSFTGLLDRQVGLEYYAGPGHWNDPDMLEVGNGNLTPDENRAHFSLWCVLAAPLLAGNDIPNMKPETIAILTNKEVIAVDQDPLGIQGAKVADGGELEVWAKPLADKAQAVLLFNRSGHAAKIGVDWTSLGWPEGTAAKVHDLWAHKDLGVVKNRFEADVPPHGVVVVKAAPVKVPEQNAAPRVVLLANDFAGAAAAGVPRHFMLRALPYDGDGRIAKVEILEGATVLKAFQGGPYTVAVDKQPGSYRFTAKVTDEKGATTTGAPLTVEVKNLKTTPTPARR